MISKLRPLPLIDLKTRSSSDDDGSINEVELSESLISLAYELELYMLILLLERRIVGRRCPVDNINAPLLKLVTDGLKDFPVALYLGEDKIGDLVALHLVLLAARK